MRGSPSALSNAIAEKYGEKLDRGKNYRQIILDSVHASLGRLGTDHVDILMCPHGASTPAELRNYPAPAFLVDGSKPGELSNVSTKADWEFAHKLREYKFTIIAGSLSADNLALAVRLAQPDGVDLSSSVESKAGVKDAAKLRHFFATVKKLDYQESRLQQGFFSLV
ncbi:hypothetical protein FBQ85_28705 [Cytophagia bacterium CHB2]|nr:hypothetical protein [Cytophagia bacterium CHB2]